MVWGNIPVVCVRTKCICMYKVQNINWVISMIFGDKLNALLFVLKTLLHKIKTNGPMNANN
jgi:hypothetical protein